MDVPFGCALGRHTLSRSGSGVFLLCTGGGERARRRSASPFRSARARAATGCTALAAVLAAARCAVRAVALLAALALLGPLARVAHATEPALDLSAHAGKVVYVDFWASWCMPCRASFPWMNTLQEELEEEGLVVIGVNTGDDPREAARFLEEVPAVFGIVTDTDGSIARAYGLEGMPMAFVHDRSGELVASHVGFDERMAEERAEELRALVAATR